MSLDNNKKIDNTKVDSTGEVLSDDDLDNVSGGAQRHRNSPEIDTFIKKVFFSDNIEEVDNK